MKNLALTLCLVFTLFHSAFPQQQQKPPAERTEEVVRIDTSLVQNTVAVFDKKGIFVDGLRPEDFQLKIDGTNDPILHAGRRRNGTGTGPGSSSSKWPATQSGSFSKQLSKTSAVQRAPFHIE